jgi:oxygen-independent coproporphyrinogen-3 oxidase
VIKQFGVTRLSLGVENFNDHILQTNGRAHRSKEVFSAYEFARGLGFDNINIDLIAGMLEETDENWTECVDRVVDLSPDCVTIYQMEVPFNTGIFKTMKEEGKLSAPVADWPTKRRWVSEAYAKLEEAGYTVTSAYTAVKNPDSTKFIYRDRLWAGADMVGVGVSSFGHLGGIHYQNLTNIDSYCDSVEAGKAPVRRALMTNEEERFIRELILQWKLGRVNNNYFLKKFGISISERYASILTQWKERGDLREEGDYLVLSRDALLRIDSMLQGFFLPEHRDARYV